MVVRIKIVLEQDEYSALLKLSLSEMRNPEEQLRFLLIKHLKRLRLLSEKKDSVKVEGNSISKPPSKAYR